MQDSSKNIRVHNSWKKIVFLNFFGWVFIYADRTILNPIMPKIQDSFSLTNSQLGLISSIFFLTYTVTQIPFAAIADYFGKKWILGLGFAFFGIMTLFSGIVTTFGIFLIMRAFTGVGEGTFYGASYSLSSENIPPKKLTFGMALINSGQSIGQAFGTLLSSFLVLQYGLHWRLPFIVIAIPTILMGLLYILLVKEEKRPKANIKTAQPMEQRPKIDVASLFNKNLVMTYILLFASIYGQIAMLTWLPQFLITDRGISGSSVGWVASLVPFASIPSSLIFAKLNDKLANPKKLLYILVPIAIISLVVGMTVNNFTILIIMLFMYGFTGKMAIDPILLYTVNKNANRNQLSTTLGVYNFFGMIASIIAPYLTGLFIDLAGSMVIGFYFAAALLLIGLFCFSFVKFE